MKIEYQFEGLAAGYLSRPAVDCALNGRDCFKSLNGHVVPVFWEHEKAIDDATCRLTNADSGLFAAGSFTLDTNKPDEEFINYLIEHGVVRGLSIAFEWSDLEITPFEAGRVINDVRRLTEVSLCREPSDRHTTVRITRKY